MYMKALFIARAGRGVGESLRGVTHTHTDSDTHTPDGQTATNTMELHGRTSISISSSSSPAPVENAPTNKRAGFTFMPGFVLQLSFLFCFGYSCVA
jgi:hypothetical protein